MSEPGSTEAVRWSWQVGTSWPLVHLSVIHQQTMVEFLLHLCLGSSVSIIGPLKSSAYHLQCTDLLSKALMQLLEPGVGTEGVARKPQSWVGWDGGG